MTRPPQLRLLLLMFLLCVFSRNFAQTYTITNFTLVDGLSQSEVYDAIEDQSGNLWLATRGGGINKFNGKDFTKVSMSDGLPSNVVFALYQDSARTLWAGTDNGLCAYNGITTKTYIWGDPDQPTVIGDIISDKYGRLWIASNKGIHVLENDSIHDYSAQFNIDIDYISFIFKDANDILWIGAGSQLIKVRDWEPTFYGREEGLTGRRLTDMTETSNGLKFIATYGEGLYLKVGQHFQPMKEMPFSETIIHEVITDSEDQLWMATQDNGVFGFIPRDSTITHLTSKDGLANDHVEAILVDSWGNYWFGTGGGGLSKYYASSFSVHDKSTGLPGDFIYSILIDSNGDKWVGTSARGITHWTDSTMITYNSSNGYKTAKTRVVMEDSAGNIWLAPEGEGLCRYDSTFINLNRANSDLPSDWVKAMTSDLSGNLWVAIAGYGITRVTADSSAKSGYRFSTFKKRDGLPKQNIYALHTDQLNRVWFGANNAGVGYIEDESIRTFTVNDGLSDNNVKVIEEDDFGSLWVGGTRLTRIYIYEDSLRFQKIGPEDGLSSSNIYQIRKDSLGNIWVGSEIGVDRFTLNEEGEIDRVKHFGHAEGFLGIETTHNAVAADSAGKMWFGTIDGLMEYHQGGAKFNTTPPKISFQGISLFYEPLHRTEYAQFVGPWGTLVSPIELAHDRNHISFEFAGVDLANPEAIMFSWKLEGFDNKWSPPIRKFDATYSNLPPGEYVFKLKAINSDGVWTAPIETPKISITPPPPPPPPFWDTLWFKITAPSLVLIIIGLFLNARFQRVKRERERLRLEKDLVQLEQKALRLQMNPHFIFNVLNTIQSLIGKKDEKGARYLLAKFSKLMRATLENSRNAIISLDEEISVLEHYLFLEKFSNNDAFDFEIKVDESIHPEGVGIPPMIVQPFVENAIIHGLKGIEHRGRITVAFEKKNHLLECTIEDNGRGRQQASNVKAQKSSYHKSTGLAVTQERLDILHGNSEMQSLQFIDKTHNNQPAGTLVRILIPLEEIV